MKLITVHKQEEGQRLVKLLGAYLKEAPNSFFYKGSARKTLHSMERKQMAQKS